jgi:hypothetical protein
VRASASECGRVRVQQRTIPSWWTLCETWGSRAVVTGSRLLPALAVAVAVAVVAAAGSPPAPGAGWAGRVWLGRRRSRSPPPPPSHWWRPLWHRPGPSSALHVCSESMGGGGGMLRGHTSASEGGTWCKRRWAVCVQFGCPLTGRGSHRVPKQGVHCGVGPGREPPAVACQEVTHQRAHPLFKDRKYVHMVLHHVTPPPSNKLGGGCSLGRDARKVVS